MNWDTDTHISWQWVKCASLSFVLYHSRLKREDLQQFWVEASEGSIISEPVIPHCFTETHMHNSQLAVALSPVNHKRLLSGLKSDFNLSPNHSSYKSSNHKIPLFFFFFFLRLPTYSTHKLIQRLSKGGCLDVCTQLFYLRGFLFWLVKFDVILGHFGFAKYWLLINTSKHVD